MDAEHVSGLGIAVQDPAPDFTHVRVPRVLTQREEGGNTGKVCVQPRE